MKKLNQSRKVDNQSSFGQCLANTGNRELVRANKLGKRPGSKENKGKQTQFAVSAGIWKSASGCMYKGYKSVKIKFYNRFKPEIA